MKNILTISVLIFLFACSNSERKRDPSNDFEKFVDGLLEIQNESDIKNDTPDSTYYCDLDFDQYLQYFDKLTI
ncbi:MAG: hypothetical protein IIA88_12255, partial [Bacteroidetes bacterium]|nr:hypothetical protein [Bacteroidota bacterium]